MTLKAEVFPTDAAERKKYPLYTGLFRYFPDALAAVARRSWEGGAQHHPGEPVHWERSKSSDEPDALLRHILEGENDLRARSAAAWRALAWLQKGIEDSRKNPPEAIKKGRK